MAVNSTESMIVTGAADSVITLWKDCTKEKEEERQADVEKTVLKYVMHLLIINHFLIISLGNKTL